MANAYATIANGGVHHDWFMVKKVTRASDGKVLYRRRRKNDRALPEDLAATSATRSSRPSRAAPARTPGLDRPAAGKTGTATNDDGDVSSSWFVGYTPQVSTAVMYVRGKGNEALNGYLPSSSAATTRPRTWTAVMERPAWRAPTRRTSREPAFVDGEAPGTGHAPYTPPPPSRRRRPRSRSPQAEADGHAATAQPDAGSRTAGRPTPDADGHGDGGGPRVPRVLRPDGPHLHP